MRQFVRIAAVLASFVVAPKIFAQTLQNATNDQILDELRQRLNNVPTDPRDHPPQLRANCFWNNNGSYVLRASTLSDAGAEIIVDLVLNNNSEPYCESTRSRFLTLANVNGELRANSEFSFCLWNNNGSYLVRRRFIKLDGTINELADNVLNNNSEPFCRQFELPRP